MTSAAPAIYSPAARVQRITWPWRVFALLVAGGCMSVLILAAVLKPDPRGIGTHTLLGLQRCQFLYQTGIPCPSCGLTTSFAYLTHGQVLASAWVQPLGTVLALLAAVTVWIGLYIAVTGKPALRLLRLIRPTYWLLPLLILAVAAWGWKVFIHTRGLDGWS